MKLTQTVLERLLKEKGFTARRTLGQNFLVDPNFLSYLIRETKISSEDFVLEIGSGPGHFTFLMAQHCRHIWAVEIDQILFKLGEELYGKTPNISFIQADILNKTHQLNPEIIEEILSSSYYIKNNPIKVVSNLPYARAAEILLALLEQNSLPIRDLYLMLQHEIAERLIAKAKEASYNALSVLVQMLSEVKILRQVPSDVFFPKPKVQSTLVRIIPRSHSSSLEPHVYFQFKNFVQKIFRYRRKTITRILATTGLISREKINWILKEGYIQPKQRPAEISPQMYLKIFSLTTNQ